MISFERPMVASMSVFCRKLTISGICGIFISFPLLGGHFILLCGNLISLINHSLTKADKQFLVDFKEGKPDWSFFSIDHIQDLPAVKWKIYNLSKMSNRERNTAINKLKDFFEI